MAQESFEKSKEELELEKIVFGDFSGFEDALLAAANGELDDVDADSGMSSDSDIEKQNDDNLFYLDAEGDEMLSESDSEDLPATSSDEGETSDVWVDDELDQTTISLTAHSRSKKLRSNLNEQKVSGKVYEQKLRSQFLTLHPQPAWAQARDSDDENAQSDEDMDLDEDETTRAPSAMLADLLAKRTDYIKSRDQQKFLPSGEIDIGRLQDLTRRQVAQSAILSLQFHPTLPLALIAGFDQTLRLYHVDGRSNPVANTLFIKGSPFKCALFHPDGRRIFAGGRRKYLFVWDLISGDVEKITRLYGNDQIQTSMEKFILSKDGQYLGLIGKNGWFNILNTSTSQYITGAKVEGVIVDAVWSSNTSVIIATREGQVYDYNFEKRQFTDHWRDVGGAAITALAVTPRWIALGMSNGVVSVYDRPIISKHASSHQSLECRIESAKAVIENLVTSVTSLKFSPDGQILAIASRSARDALKLVHVPTFTVFKNWPTSATPLGRITNVAYSASGTMMSVSNDKGIARLFQLNHYV